jgi:uncharacterized membrane protein required for colicin V production
MSFLLPAALFLIFVICVGFLYTEGMWGNALRLINVVTAALLATNFWEPMANFLEQNVSKSFTYFWDFISLWVLFIFFLLIFRTATKFASKVNVRFLALANRIGGAAFAVWIGWVMVCFTLMTLQDVPGARARPALVGLHGADVQRALLAGDAARLRPRARVHSQVRRSALRAR